MSYEDIIQISDFESYDKKMVNKFTENFGCLEKKSYLCKPIISKFNISRMYESFWPGLNT